MKGIPYDDPLAKAATLAQMLCALDDTIAVFFISKWADSPSKRAQLGSLYEHCVGLQRLPIRWNLHRNAASIVHTADSCTNNSSDLRRQWDG